MTADGKSSVTSIGTIAESAEDNPSPVLLISKEGRIEYANAASWMVLHEWNADVGDVIPAPWDATVRRAFERNQTQPSTLTAGILSLQLLFVPDLSQQNVAVFGADITPVRQLENDLIIKAHVYSQAQEAIVVTDEEFRAIDINPSYTRITGFTEADTLGEIPGFIRTIRRDPERGPDFTESLSDRGAWQGEIWDRSKNGERAAIRVSVTAVNVKSEAVTHYVALITDITSYKAAEEQLYRMAHYDALTGLPNRYFFADNVRETIRHARRTGESFAIMILDLDGFKAINDTFGHRAGDTLLKSTSDRMADTIRKSDLVARIGGDEFAILLRDLAGANDAARIARKLLESIPKSIEVDGHELFVTASIGVAMFPRDEADIDALIGRADSAMYKVKRLGKNDLAFFSEDLQSDVVRSLKVQTSVRNAIHHLKPLSVHYQPQIDTRSGALIGMEALARWSDSRIGDVAPGEFISAAEECGLIHIVGERVLRLACAQGARWVRELAPDIRIGVNVSVRQLLRNDFVQTVKKVLEETGFAAGRLELELTETIFIDDPSTLIPALHDLASMGISLSVDDFGTRYASLLYIKNLPINRLKIDQMFVADVPSDRSAAQIVNAIVVLGRSLGCEVIAEGVESAEQLAFLRDNGCEQMQGYLASPPLPADDLEEIVRSGHLALEAQ